MKFSVFKLILIFVGVYLLFKYLPAIPISSVVTQKTDLFTVTGEGKVTVVPDTAIVNLGINVTRSTVKDAQSQANMVIKDITASLKNLNIADKDVKTSDYSIYPQYDYTSGGNRITGYAVNASLVITVRDLDKINQAIDSATAAGANTVSGVQLTVDDARQKGLLQQARELAIAEAKDKAASLANSAGMVLGRIVNIQESSPGSPRPIMFDSAKAVTGLGGASPATQIQPGSTDIVSDVTLSYETRWLCPPNRLPASIRLSPKL